MTIYVLDIKTRVHHAINILGVAMASGGLNNSKKGGGFKIINKIELDYYFFFKGGTSSSIPILHNWILPTQTPLNLKVKKKKKIEDTRPPILEPSGNKIKHVLL